MDKIVSMTLEEAMKNPLSQEETEKLLTFEDKLDDEDCPVFTDEQLTKMVKNKKRRNIIISVEEEVLNKLLRNNIKIQEYVDSNLQLIAKTIA